jgi:electron transfer flavoprotein alpha subunit
MSTLLVADHDNTSLKEATAKAMTAARALGAPVTVLVAGQGANAAADAAAKLDGATKVLLADHESLAEQLAEPMAALISSLASGYKAIVFVSSTSGKNVAPRVAALLDSQPISEVMAVHGADTFDRPIYAGNAIQTVTSADAVKVMTIRTASFSASAMTATAPVESIPAAADPGLSKYLRAEIAKLERPELQSAKIVVSGGRALGSSDKFKEVILPLADTFGAAVGASRAAVDAGYAPNDYQVGQTGKVVAPDLYVAVGISGAIQHLAGMKDSKVIVAINKDEEAPIFQVADYGLVGDLFAIVPELEKALTK